MPLIREVYDTSDFIDFYGEPIETFREEWEFEVDGIKYVHPWRRPYGEHPQVVHLMFDLKYDDGS